MSEATWTCPNVGKMLGHCLREWPNINTARVNTHSEYFLVRCCFRTKDWACVFIYTERRIQV